MTLQEIVCVIIDQVKIVSDPYQIEAARTFGQRLEYITRGKAQAMAALHRSGEWVHLAMAKTIFLTDGVSIFGVHRGC
jgi:hypothetical protein